MTTRPLRTITALALAASALAATFVRTIPFIDGYIYAYECHAIAPGATTITISHCSTDSIDDPPIASESVAGARITVGGVARDTQPTQVCWTASATYADGTSQMTSGCTITSEFAGAGAGTS